VLIKRDLHAILCLKYRHILFLIDSCIHSVCSPARKLTRRTTNNLSQNIKQAQYVRRKPRRPRGQAERSPGKSAQRPDLPETHRAPCCSWPCWVRWLDMDHCQPYCDVVGLERQPYDLLSVCGYVRRCVYENTSVGSFELWIADVLG
jgi:hypothetical protein